MADIQNPFDDETFRSRSEASDSKDDVLLPDGEAASGQGQRHVLAATLGRNGQHQLSGPLAALHSNTAPEGTGSPQDRRRKLLPYILGAVGVIFILSCLGIGAAATFSLFSFQSSLNSPQTTVSDFYNALETGNYRSAYNQLASSCQQNTSYDQFQASYSLRDVSNGPIQRYTIGNLSTQGNNASTAVTLVRQMQGGKPVQQAQTVQLVVENSAWKIKQITGGQYPLC